MGECWWALTFISTMTEQCAKKRRPAPRVQCILFINLCLLTQLVFYHDNLPCAWEASLCWVFLVLHLWLQKCCVLAKRPIHSLCKTHTSSSQLGNKFRIQIWFCAHTASALGKTLPNCNACNAFIDISGFIPSHSSKLLHAEFVGVVVKQHTLISHIARAVTPATISPAHMKHYTATKQSEWPRKTTRTVIFI